MRKFCKQDSATAIVTIRDTITIKEQKVDTVFNVKTDSVTIQKDRVVVKYIRRGDTVYIQGKCLSDTIYIKKTVQVKVATKCPDVCNRTFLGLAREARWYIIVAFLIGTVFGLWLQFRRK